MDILLCIAVILFCIVAAVFLVIMSKDEGRYSDEQ
jgi:hypothetical protein